MASFWRGASRLPGPAMSFASTLRGAMVGIAEFAGSRYGRFRIPRLRIDESLPLGKKLDLLDAWLEKLYARGMFNGTVLIAQSGRVLFHKNYGYADIDSRVRLTNRSSFNLASVSKPFTAMGILMLARRKKLSLDDPMAKYIPDLSFYGDITIRQLLHHTSGLPDFMELAEECWDEDKTLTIGDMIGLLRAERLPLEFEPGEEFEYSNTGYALLGEIIARVSGMSYAEFMKKEVFEPLGMKHSAAFNRLSEDDVLEARVYGFRKKYGAFGQKEACDLNYLDGIFGDGGICASAEDLVRWDDALRKGTLIPARDYEEAMVSGTLNDGEETGYGYGWNIEEDGLVCHSGEWQGFTSYVQRDLESQTLLVVLANSGLGDSADAISSELGDFVDTIE